MNAAKLASNPGTMSPAKEKWNRYWESIRYAFHVIFHPFDGFWDLAHEKRGTIAAATTFLVLFLVTRVVTLMFTNFQFINAPLQYVNVFEQTASLLFPFLILCLANWSLTTLFEGKGRFSDIYIAMCYALVPYVIIQLPLVFVSNIIAFDEGAFYNVLLSVSVIWSVLLIFVGLMQVHDYSPGKTLIFLVATVLGAMIIIFLILVFFSLLGDAVSFFISLYREIAFRLN
ncbi:MAG: YIP1 family protein [Clostridiales bacterium]|nr:YIP1 family protein [Clostridiales bacterium]